jgi:hypothetical protein
MLDLHVLALVVLEGLAHDVLGLADGQFAGAFDGQLAVHWRFQEQVVGSVHSELEIKVSVEVGLLLDLPHEAQHLRLELLVEAEAGVLC